MATIATLLKLTDESVFSLLQEAGDKLDDAGGEVVMDFSSMPQISVEALSLVEEFMGKADAKSVKVMLRGVNVDVYKVLTLVKLATRFSFIHSNARS